jgi:hypothetical protein
VRGARHAGSVLVRVRGEGLAMTDAAADATRANCPKTRNSREGRCAPPGRAAFARTRREPEVRTEKLRSVLRSRRGLRAAPTAAYCTA